MDVIKVGVALIEPPEGAIGGKPSSERWFNEIESKIKEYLTSYLPDFKFYFKKIKDYDDVIDFLKEGRDCVGHLILVLNCITGLLRPLIWSGKPTILIAETYGGAGDFLLEYPHARERGVPVIGLITRDLCNEIILRKLKLLKVIHQLKNSRILFIVSPGERYLMSLEYPLSVDLYSIIRELQTIAGVNMEIMNVKEFIQKYYSKVKEEAAKVIAKKWINDAEGNLERETEEIIKSAKLYLALRRAVEERQAQAVAVDCIVLRNSGLLDAWPCLSYMELWNDNVIPVCEADASSALIMLAMNYLTGRPGFIADPSPDNLRDEVVYYHCYAPLTPYGKEDKRCPYIITSAHLGVKKASVHVKLPVNETVTAVGLSPEERLLVVHVGKAVANELSEHACATKLIVKANTKALIRKWRKRAGWHRVIFYGDWREELRDLATLLGLRFLEEDE